jgi:hypothetical protein
MIGAPYQSDWNIRRNGVSLPKSISYEAAFVSQNVKEPGNGTEFNQIRRIHRRYQSLIESRRCICYPEHEAWSE